MGTRKITAVLFDWDLTLCFVGETRSFARRIALQFQMARLAYSMDEVEAAYNRRKELVALHLLPGKERPQKHSEILLSYKQILALLGHHNPTPTLLNRLYNTFALLPMPLYSDALPALQALSQQGLRLGIVSNTGSNTKKAMERCVGLLIPGRHITISEEEHIHKPAKTIFLRAAARLRVRPEECMYVGDNLDVDARGAIQNGGYAAGVWIPREEKEMPVDRPSNLYRINSLCEIIDLL